MIPGPLAVSIYFIKVLEDWIFYIIQISKSVQSQNNGTVLAEFETYL